MYGRVRKIRSRGRVSQLVYGSIGLLCLCTTRHEVSILVVGVGVWALLRWLTYILMAIATVWQHGRGVEEAPSRRSEARSGQVGSSRGVESSRVPSKYRVGVVRSGQFRSDQPANRPMQRGGSVWVVG